MGRRAGLERRWLVIQSLLTTVDRHWLVLSMTVVMFALMLGGYYTLWKLSEALDNRTDRRRAAALAVAIERERHEERAATDRVQATYPVRRYQL